MSVVVLSLLRLLQNRVGFLIMSSETHARSETKGPSLTTQGGGGTYDPFSPELKALIHQWQDRYSKDAASPTMTVQQTRQALSQMIQSDAYRDTKPSRGVVFIKTHKTGGSTVTSVLHALATAHNLSTPVVKKSPGKRWFPGKDLQEMLQLPSTTNSSSHAPFDIWANHVVYDNALVTHVVVPGAKVVSIVRDPAARLRSACQYYRCCPSDADDPTIFESFVLKNPPALWLLHQEPKCHCCADETAKEIVGMGLEPTLTETQNRALLLERVESGDILLLVTERMEESMLALLHDLQLHPLDAAFLSKKVELKATKQKTSDCIAAEQRVREWAPYDARMHEIANQMLTTRMNMTFVNATEATWLLSGLNDILFHACSSDDGDESTNITDSVLGYWCSEKMLDNSEWNNKHAKMLGLG